MKTSSCALPFVVVALIFMINEPLAAQANEKALPQLGRDSLRQVIASMTLEEKVKLLVGNGFQRQGPQPGGPVVGNTQDKVPGAAGTTFAIPRLGIPSMVIADGPAGVRISPNRLNDTTQTYFATAWPIATLLASTWDTALVRSVGIQFGQEVHEYGIDILLGPGLNIHRSPLGGRNFEYFSEDPLMAGTMAAAIVNGIQSNGVGASIKHFAANNQETNRNTINTIVTERTLREIYLKGFEIAVKGSQPWTVMSSYNLINGKYTSEDHDLLTTILRKEWGFKGLVMTDWFGGKDPVEQMKAGNDLIMPGSSQQSAKILSAARHDSLNLKVLDENVARMLGLVLKSPTFKKYKNSDRPDLRKSALISRMAATEGMVLLKNTDKALPLGSGRSVAAFGNATYETLAGGTGSGEVNKAYTISLFEGLVNAGLIIDEALRQSYINYLSGIKAKRPKIRNFFEPSIPIDEMVLSKEIISAKANSLNVAVVTVGRNSGEFRDRNLEGDYYLKNVERDLIQNVSEAFHAVDKKVIVVLNIGGPVEVASWRDRVDAILIAWQPGLEAGNAISDVLSGKVNPSGKLPTTFPMDYKDTPSAKNFPGKEFPEKAVNGAFGRKIIPAEVKYEEGIYVGYRYFNTFGIKPAYEFGFGLSFTEFSYDNLKLNSGALKDEIQATVTITNIGKVAGKEVVQVYVSAPGKHINKPAEELRAFAKTDLLNPGSSQTITFTITTKDLASFDTKSTSWITEGGKYTLKIGSSSETIKQTVTFSIPRDVTIKKVNKVMVPQVVVTELTK